MKYFNISYVSSMSNTLFLYNKIAKTILLIMWISLYKILFLYAVFACSLYIKQQSSQFIKISFCSLSSFQIKYNQWKETERMRDPCFHIYFSLSRSLYSLHESSKKSCHVLRSVLYIYRCSLWFIYLLDALRLLLY